MMKKALSLVLSLILLLSVSSVFAEDPGILVKEEDGGEFRPLPIDLDGGSPVPYLCKYDPKAVWYEDPTIRVERYRVDRAPEWVATYWYAFITIRDASQLRTASVSEANPFLDSLVNSAKALSRRKKAVLAINGDYCASFTSTKNDNYILRQGTVYRDSVMPNLDILLIDEDGDFHVLRPDETDLAAADKTQINGKKVVNALQFGPALVIDGEKVPDEIVMDPAHSPYYAQPERRGQRMCICQIDSLHYMALCCANYGMDLASVRDLVLSLAPVKTAYILDGGESSQMYFLGNQYNAGANGHTETRPLTDILYFASAWFVE